MVELSKVFIAGGQPTITYNPRSELKLEEKLNEYLDTGYKILSITGPTKSGKTVLVHSRLNSGNSCWISGGQISNLDDFWDNIIEKYKGYTDITEVLNDTKGKTEGEILDGGLNIGIAKVDGTTTIAKTEQTSLGLSQSRSTLTLSHFRTNRYQLVEFINIVNKLNSLSVSLM